MDWDLAENLVLFFYLFDAAVDSLESLVFVGLDDFGIIGGEVDVFDDFFLDDYFFRGLLDIHLFDDRSIYFLDDFFGDIDWHLDNLLDPPLSSLQPFNWPLPILMLFWDIAAFETAAQHRQLHLALLLQTVLPFWLLVDLHRLVLLVDRDTALLGAAADQWH